MSNLTYEALKNQVLSLEKDAEAFYEKGNKAAGTRYRKGLLAVRNLCSDIRKDVQNRKKFA